MQNNYAPTSNYRIALTDVSIFEKEYSKDILSKNFCTNARLNETRPKVTVTVRHISSAFFNLSIWLTIRETLASVMGIPKLQLKGIKWKR